MRNLLLLGLLLSCTALETFSQSRYIDDVFADRSIQKQSLTYASKEGQDLQMDVYAPPMDSIQQRPAMVWVHGGGFSGGSRDSEGEVKLMRSLARKGYVAISISYRLLRKGKKEGFGCACSTEEKMHVFQEAAEDLLDAVLFVKKNKERLGVDVNKIILGGSSAGAETVLNAAFMRNSFFSKQNEYLDLKFAAVLSLAGAVVDARYITPHNAVPILMFHGTADKLVPYGTAPHHYCKPEEPGYLWLDGSQSIAQKLQELKQSYLFYTSVNGNHDLAQIPFDQLDLILFFLKEVALEGKYKVLSVDEG